jgi:4a-hydroxytetrahydrobiopterin dehydratase
MEPTHHQLASRRCIACEGDVPRLAPVDVHEYIRALPGWVVVNDNHRIRRELSVKDFATALDYLVRIGSVADAAGHHPDLHVTRYRQVVIELWTHAAGGLTENDFILAAKIDEVPVELHRRGVDSTTHVAP